MYKNKCFYFIFICWMLILISLVQCLWRLLCFENSVLGSLTGISENRCIESHKLHVCMCGVFQTHTCPPLFTIRLLPLFALNQISHYRKDTNSNIWSKSPCKIIHQRGRESFTEKISVTVWMEFFSSCNVWCWLPFSDFFSKKFSV